MKIKAIVKRPDEPAGHMTNISNTLKNLQRIVEGPIEILKIAEGVILVVNEEGKLRGLEHNFICGQDVIVGEVAVVGVDGDEFADVPITMDIWRWLLRQWGN